MEQNTAKQRVCAYCRVSTKAEKQEQSLISQIEYFNNLINENPNYINMGIYAEKKSRRTVCNSSCSAGVR